MRAPAVPAVLVATGILASRVAGLVRQRVFAHFFGNSLAADAFTAAMRIPNFMQSLLGEGALSASFIPVYSRLLGAGRDEEADRVAGAVGALLALVTAAIVAAGVVAAPLLATAIVPGFAGERRELTVTLIRIFFPGIGLLVMSAWCLGVLNSHRRFLMSYSAPVLWNAAIIVAMVSGGGRPLSELAVWTAWGSVAGSVLQFVVQLPAVARVAPRLRFALDTSLAGVRTALANFGPAALARGVVQVSAFVDQMIASVLPTGAVAAIGYAQTLYLLPVSLFGMSVSASELPEMARAGAAADDPDAAAAVRDRLSTALRRVAFLIVPSAVAFIVIGDAIVALIFQTGAFGASDVRYVWGVLAAASVGLPAATLARLYSSTFFALHDTRTPLRIAVARVALGSALSLALALWAPAWAGLEPRWGAVGITLGSALAAWLELALLARALDVRLGRVRPGAGHGARVVAASLLAAAAGAGAAALVPESRPVIRGVVAIAAFGAVYLAAAAVLGAGDVRALLRRAPR